MCIGVNTGRLEISTNVFYNIIYYTAGEVKLENIWGSFRIFLLLWRLGISGRDKS